MKTQICVFCQPILEVLHKKIKVVVVNDGFVIILAIVCPENAALQEETTRKNGKWHACICCGVCS
ncbi:MAG: hypothetical protein R6X10_15910 [Desulfobacterales bacterium]